METISVSEFKAVCLRLLREVKEMKKSLTITKGNEPIAMIIPMPAKKNRKFQPFGSMKAQTKILGNIEEPLDIAWELD